MKKLLFCLVVLLSLVSLNSCDEKSRIERDVKNQLKKHLQRSMNDADSYELVEFNMFRNDGKKKQDSLDILILAKHNDDGKFKKVWDSLRKARDITIGEYDRSGLIRYRGKNSFGATVINQSSFYVKISSIDNRSEVYEIGSEPVSIYSIEK